ncbi:MAG: TIGR03905 family TSCPD domain-containing protein [Muribaculaceae bacterium]|nr:TIGR03905 family TSCPD domain-containing protein [Muribaculaceae bacterium]MDE7141526.1 TIGR03905 family TSCPD domain-containing protein [Muribaculaceae bacterium]
MIYEYSTSGTCSRKITLDVADDGTISNVEFLGGCPGNTLGVCTLAKGRKASEIAGLCRGIPCRDKGTSCPDQLARFIDTLVAENRIKG